MCAKAHTPPTTPSLPESPTQVRNYHIHTHTYTAFAETVHDIHVWFHNRNMNALDIAYGSMQLYINTYSRYWWIAAPTNLYEIFFVRNTHCFLILWFSYVFRALISVEYCQNGTFVCFHIWLQYLEVCLFICNTISLMGWWLLYFLVFCLN